MRFFGDIHFNQGQNSQSQSITNIISLKNVQNPIIYRKTLLEEQKNKVSISLKQLDQLYDK